MVKTIYTIIIQTIDTNGTDTIEPFASYKDIDIANYALKELYENLYSIWDTKLIEYDYLFCYKGAYDSNNHYHYSFQRYYKIIKNKLL